MNEAAYLAGHQAAIEGNHNCPHPLWSFDYWSWHAGNIAGHQALCAGLEFIINHFPQD